MNREIVLKWGSLAIILTASSVLKLALIRCFDPVTAAWISGIVYGSLFTRWLMDYLP